MSLARMDAAAAATSNVDLVQRILAGDRAAEVQFVRQYQAGVRALVRRHCRPNDPCVDDLVQDVLQCVLQKLRGGELRNAGALPGYVQTIAVNSTTAEYRRRGRLSEVSDEALATSVVDDNPLRDVERRELGTRVRAVLADLPVARDREILDRFYLQEQSKAAVCASLGIDESHFHRVVYRARERLRELAERAGLEGA